MPRLPPALIRRAAHENPFLPLLLRVCRELPSARNELRWLEEYARETVAARKCRLYDSQYSGVKSASGGPGKQDQLSRNGRHEVNVRRKEEFRHNHGQVLSKSVVQSDGKAAERNFSTSHSPSSGSTQPDGPPRAVWSWTKPGVPAKKKAKSTSKVRDKKSPPGHTAGYINRILSTQGFRKHSSHEAPRVRRFESKVPKYMESQSSPIPNPRVDDARGRTTGESEVAVSHSTNHKSESDLENSEADDTSIRQLMTKAVIDRSRGMPLQYILGNQPFGSLDILTQGGVLIPRPETETYTEEVARLLLRAINEAVRAAEQAGVKNSRKVRILDLCTGTGCMALLIHSILKPPVPDITSRDRWPSHYDLEILGVDMSPRAIEVANQNLQHNISKNLLHPDATSDISFMKEDILNLAKIEEGQTIREMFNSRPGARPGQDLDESWDVVVCNPPYISRKDYAAGGRTESSVRKFEPKLALVPNDEPSVHSGDLFYWPLTRLFKAVGARLLVMEVGDSQQAVRVHKTMARNFKSWAVLQDPPLFFECWNDSGSLRPISVFGPEAGRLSPTGMDNVSDRAMLVWSESLAEWRQHLAEESPRFGEFATPPHQSRQKKPKVLDQTTGKTRSDDEAPQEDTRTSDRPVATFSRVSISPTDTPNETASQSRSLIPLNEDHPLIDKLAAQGKPAPRQKDVKKYGNLQRDLQKATQHATRLREKLDEIPQDSTATKAREKRMGLMRQLVNLEEDMLEVEADMRGVQKRIGLDEVEIQDLVEMMRASKAEKDEIVADETPISFTPSKTSAYGN
ncbi:hypothetical protein LTR99_010316 [Exophiala xenobiotica]|uniref:Site-specific DNA-methyltransferase (adenine-specific) n=1 Tax=Vermiconidia calcicola TaxID=1690605 RepID=A0AAV9Q4X5_9PEZI|nr:hypothetical protein LTR96_010534 [Exophiala xenobiotica]KAK5534035.1 hypothetical protein LTR25_007015 [Vermiconidia calcicola]KAK5538076.1 hypothetical protein LTR23_007213 [Chaetothyriales sp. CCFEE 6169]KAK5292568.1 hypothetical protein LTR99_010316 [Exophiala xenobiotica]KAK5342245.1 hypothetical protein LTR98_003039 [Exophiala xenobiotica]